MMVINCSAAAAAHLYARYKKDQDEGFFEPASSVQETITERQEKLTPSAAIQWVVHAVKIGRSTCLIAMEFTTRWVHVIHQVRKGDVNGFVERLNSRLINGVEWLGNDFSLFTTDQMEASINRFFTRHRELRFFQQTDRSTITHINQVSMFYQNMYHSIGVFPGDEEIALEFDLRLNHDWRCRKGEPFDLMVDEKMLVLWMTQYIDENGRKAAQMIDRVKHVRREMLKTPGDMSEDTPPFFTGNHENDDNVISIEEHLKRRKLH